MADITTREMVDIFEQARIALRSTGYITEAGIAQFNAALVELERAAWERGMDFGSSIVQRQLDRHAELLLQVSASMRGKDRADGRITTDIYPDPAIYNWKGETE